MPLEVNSAASQSLGAGLPQLELRHRWQCRECAIRIPLQDWIGPLDACILKASLVEDVVPGRIEKQPAQAPASQRVHRFGVEIESSQSAGRVDGQPEKNAGQERLVVGSATSDLAGTRCCSAS